MGFFRVTLCLSFLLGMVLACGSAPSQPEAEQPAASAAPTAEPTSSVQGLDVSHFSGQVDWTAVSAAGKVFAFAKATEGVDYTDPMFQTNWTGMADANLIRGAYHFYVVDDDPQQQATQFINQVTLEPGDLPPVVDIETPGSISGATLAANLQTWLDQVESHYGVKPMIYTNASFWDANLSGDFSAYPLWIAEYDVDEPKLPNGFTQWVLWQYQGDGQVDGVSSDVDLDVFQGDENALKQLCLPPK